MFLGGIRVWDMKTLLILIDSSPFMVLFKDRQGRWIWMNRAFIKEMDLPPREEILGKRTQDLLPESKDLCREDLEVVARGEPLLGLLRKVTLPSGRKRWHLTDKIPIKTPDGKVKGVATFVRDVTEQAEIQKSMERLNKLISAIRDVNQLILKEEIGSSHLLNKICNTLVSAKCYEDFWIVLHEPCTKDLLQIISSTNKSKDQLDKYLSDRRFLFFYDSIPKEGVLALKYDDLVRIGWQIPEWHADCTLLATRLEYQDKTYGIMFALFPDDVKLDEREGELFLELAGDIAYAINSLDVREKLRKEEAFLARLFEASPEGIVLSTADGYILNANDAFCRLFGFACPEEVIGYNIDDLITDEKHYEEARLLTEAVIHVIHGESISVESVRRRSDGTFIDVSILSVPIRIDENIIGVYAIYRDITDKKMLERAMEENIATLSYVWRQTIELLASVSELRDPYTAGHQKRVAELAKFMAMKMRLLPESVDAVEMASLVHDVGKIKVPAEILSKPGPLDEVEYLLVKTHPQAGYNLLKDIDFPWPVAEIVLQHHERLDGSGYPQGLKGKEILQEARIIAVADVVEAMASDRPYRKALGIEAALKEIKRGRGTLYDEEAVDACLDLFEEGLVVPLFEKVIF